MRVKAYKGTTRGIRSHPGGFADSHVRGKTLLDPTVAVSAFQVPVNIAIRRPKGTLVGDHFGR